MSTYKISRTKTITTTYNITGVHINFAAFDEAWKQIDARRKGKMDSCFVCSRKFADDEKFSLLFMSNQLNKVACNDCALEIKKKLEVQA